ncbi:MAG: hypothetical protein FJW40_22525 [Acidobacteria bacterium]|nr:hypothetical protein [Acidobacteriota bacterium]
MPGAPLPPSLEQLGSRHFAFFPAIFGVEHNEWTFRQASWSEILVVNVKSGTELWVPRRFVGEVSRVDEPMVIIGLTRELELRGGMLVPHERRVIEMPRAVNAPILTAEARDSAPPPMDRPLSVENARSGPASAESRIGRLVAVTLLLGIAACALFISFYRGVFSGDRVTYKGVLQSSFGLSGLDDYYAVVRKLGTPATDKWKSEVGEVQYRALAYPDKGLTAILMGRERNKALYIGALDRDWRVVDSVNLPGGSNTYQMLARLERF